MNSGPDNKICVVIVTYGDRVHLLSKVLAALAMSTVIVDRVVVVNNGSTSSLDNLSAGGCEIDMIELGRNIGSAAGFKAGLQRAAESDCNLIWLLDDDNVPETDALEAILLKRELLGNKIAHVFAGLRLDREKYVRAATTDFTLGIKQNSFFGFSVVEIPGRVLQRVIKSSPLKTSDYTRFGVKKIGYGIYGGLLFHRSWLLRAGFPNEEFYLYMDDTEYTTRLVQMGAEIFLVPESRIKDIDIAWFQKSKKNLSPLVDSETDIQKLYYTVRNSCFLSIERFVNSKSLFYLNIFVYLLVMFIRGILAGNSIHMMVKRFRIILLAITDGVQGKLGFRNVSGGAGK